jgi:hypothetical protein
MGHLDFEAEAVEWRRDLKLTAELHRQEEEDRCVNWAVDYVRKCTTIRSAGYLGRSTKEIEALDTSLRL